MTRKPLIAGNWKMNNTISEAVVLAQEISNEFDRDWLDNVDVAVCPPYIDLKPVLTVFEFDRLKVAVGAQNVYWEPSGAYTGEISVNMLREIGCKYCIVGHSERRNLLGETNEDVNAKVKALIGEHVDPINPIVCVGESLAVRDEGTYIEFITAQVKAAFAGLNQSDVKNAVVAYEPVWAIGSGRTATPEQAQEVCAAIRSTLSDMFTDECAQGMRILYGGSMNEGNANLLLAQPDIDGGLIGGASLKAKSFISIVKEAL
ncbi:MULTISPECIES: triose-phosphate isomerase [unclassified Adlercreutzia]|uniref:triose-phosphate isomerase n=1 Tax=unclassified Adlercreutzia TaxID=2636013 RepID=UPI0013EB0877|nr:MULTISPECIES: triose-phosphate isomerase [unclassified Adlercreutzia]